MRRREENSATMRATRREENEPPSRTAEDDVSRRVAGRRPSPARESLSSAEASLMQKLTDEERGERPRFLVGALAPRRSPEASGFPSARRSLDAPPPLGSPEHADERPPPARTGLDHSDAGKTPPTQPKSDAGKTPPTNHRQPDNGAGKTRRDEETSSGAERSHDSRGSSSEGDLPRESWECSPEGPTCVDSADEPPTGTRTGGANRQRPGQLVVPTDSDPEGQGGEGARRAVEVFGADNDAVGGGEAFGGERTDSALSGAVGLGLM